MLFYRAYKFRMYPSFEQKSKLNQNIGSSRFIYNFHLAKKDEIYTTTGKNWPLKEMCSNLIWLQSEYKWLKDVDGCALRTALFDLDDSYKRYFRKQGNHPKFKSKYARNSYRTNCIRSSYMAWKEINKSTNLLCKFADM